MQTAYFIRSISTNKMINAYEGKDGKARADELVSIRNKFYPEDGYYVGEEKI